jgi:heat-inducible transcriptional repressor
MQTRQQTILEILVEEYIKTAEPVGSQILVENYKLEISPATVRSEMAELTDAGYLKQPHTSAGRIPTDKGYRFFVDNLMEEKNLTKTEENALRSATKRKAQRQFAKEMAKTISLFSQNLGICAFLEKEDFFSSGLTQLIKEPEFMRFPGPFEILEDALSFFDQMDKEIEKIFALSNNDVRVLIGKENKIQELDDFSFVVSRCGRKGVVGVLGPKRMDYAKNIALVDYARNIINNSI